MMVSRRLYFGGLAIAGLLVALVALAAPGPVLGAAALPLASIGFVVGSAVALIFGIIAIFSHGKFYPPRTIGFINGMPIVTHDPRNETEK